MWPLKANVRAKFHLDPSNRLATVHQRYTQGRQTDNGPIAMGEPFYKRSPKNYGSFGDLTAKWKAFSL